MGYSTDWTGRLACDSCGHSGGVRKRRCPYKVDHHDGTAPLSYCMAPALCDACYKAEGGLRGVHGERCRENAAKAQEMADAEHARLVAGDAKIRTRWGSWHEMVPAGYVGARYVSADGTETFVLVVESTPDQNAGWLSEVSEPHPWVGPDVPTKELIVS